MNFIKRHASARVVIPDIIFEFASCRAKTDNVGKKILQTLIEKRPKFAEYFGIQSESLDIRALNQSKEFHLQVS